MERLTPKKFKELFDKAAYEKDYTLSGCGKVHGVFSKVDDSYVGNDTTEIKALFKRGITEQIQASVKGNKVASIGFSPIERNGMGGVIVQDLDLQLDML